MFTHLLFAPLRDRLFLLRASVICSFSVPGFESVISMNVGQHI